MKKSITMTIFLILTHEVFWEKLIFRHLVISRGLTITIILKNSNFWVLPLVKPFFHFLKNHEKGPKTVLKLKKSGEK